MAKRMNETGPSQRCIGDWVLGSVLGNGSFAVVWKAQHRSTGQPAAVKEINLEKLTAKLRSSLESEVSIMKRISHANIVTLFEVLEAHGRLFLIMEYCEGGDLSQYLRTSGRLPEATARTFLQHLAAGLQEMTSRHVVHRDLKPQNLLLSSTSPNNAILKIADFGFARALGPQLMAETLCGSPLYMAPEILLSQPYDAKADLWSVGTILFEMVAGAPPYSGANQVALLRAIREREARLPPDVAAQLSPECRQLVGALLRRNPDERLTFRQFFRHPFLDLSSPPASPRDEPPPILGFEGRAVTATPGVPPPAAVPLGRLSEEFRPDKVSGAGITRPLGSYRPRLVSMGMGGGGGVAGVPNAGIQQSMTEDEGFVLVEKFTVPPPPRLHEVPPPSSPKPHTAGDATAAAAGSQKRPSAHQEAFLLGEEEEEEAELRTGAVQAGAGGGAGRGQTPTEGTPTHPQVHTAVPWQAASRRQFLFLVAGIVGDLGAAAAPPGAKPAKTPDGTVAQLAARLSFYLAALQLYDYVLASGIESSRGEVGEACGGRHSMHSSVDSADSCTPDPDTVRAEAGAALQHAQRTAEALQVATTALGPAAAAAAGVDLPNPWRMGHSAALAWAAEAASEELLGNFAHSNSLYAKAGMLLHFLASEGKALPCHPPPTVAPEDEPQLRRCASAAAARWAACADAAARVAAGEMGPPARLCNALVCKTVFV